MLAASFGNISFFVRQETINEYGQKFIQHDYPQSSKRYMEKQGKSPLNLSAEIFFYGENYKDNYELFKLAVEDGEARLLIIPTFGAFENIVAKPSSASVSHSNLGEITTSVTFFETEEKPSPTSSTASSQDVASVDVDVGGAF